jgi:hypothetical protein
MEPEFTGDRIVPGMATTYGVTEHLHRYPIALEFCGGIRRKGARDRARKVFYPLKDIC